MKKFILWFLILLLLAAGAAWLIYPTGVEQWSAKENAELMGRYYSQVHGMPAAEISGMLQAAGAYNAELETEPIGDVFTRKNSRANNRYQNLLKGPEGIIGQLQIPRIGVKLPVYHTSQANSPEKKLIHVAGTSLPAEGAGLHMVLAGPGQQKETDFRGSLGLKGPRMLQEMELVKPGDQMILLVLDRTMVFQVEEVQTLSADGLERLEPPGNPDENWLTVMTEREGGRRLLVQGRQTSIPEETESLTAADRSDMPPDWLNILALGSPVLLLGLFILWVIERFMKRAYRLPAPEEDPEKE